MKLMRTKCQTISIRHDARSVEKQTCRPVNAPASNERGLPEPSGLSKLRIGVLSFNVKPEGDHFSPAKDVAYRLVVKRFDCSAILTLSCDNALGEDVPKKIAYRLPIDVRGRLTNDALAEVSSHRMIMKFKQRSVYA
jgi:hypothetical protein